MAPWMSSVRRYGSTLWTSACRVKTPPPPGQTSQGQTTTWEEMFDLVCSGLGWSTCVGVVVTAGIATAHVTGTSSLICLLVAVVVASLNALCYTELRARCRLQSGSSYTFTYSSIGEGVATLVGWSTVLNYLAISAATARSITQNFDALLSQRISKVMVLYVGKVPLVDTVPDLLAPVSVLGVCFLVVMGVHVRRLAALITSCCVAALLIFALTVGMYKIDFGLWSKTDQVFLHGSSGIFEASALFVYTFTVVQHVAVKITYDNTEDNSRRLSRKLAVAMCLCLVVLAVLCGSEAASVSLLSDPRLLHSETPYVEALVASGYKWIRYIWCPVVMFALLVSLVQTFRYLLLIVASLSEDGLLFGCLTDLHRPVKASIASALLATLFIGIYAIVFPVKTLLFTASLACLLTFTATCVSSLVLRYKPYLMQSPRHRATKQTTSQSLPHPTSNNYGSTAPGTRFTAKRTDTDQNSNNEYTNISLSDACDRQWNGDDSSSDTDIDEAVEDYREEVRLSTYNSCYLTGASRSCPSDATHRSAVVATVVCTLSAAALSTISTEFFSSLQHGSIVAIVVLCFVLLVFVLSFFLLMKQPVESAILQDLAYHVRPTPLVQVITIVLNVHLMVAMPGAVWLQLCLWIAFGFLVYITYGKENSQAATTTYTLLAADEESNLISDEQAQQPDNSHVGTPSGHCDNQVYNNALMDVDATVIDTEDAYTV